MPPNVLLIVMDSVRSKNTFIGEYDRSTTPHLSSIADEATIYTQARAPGGNSQSSHTSIFTGQHVAAHGITDPYSTLAPNNTIWEQLANEGYSTGVFSSNVFLTQASVGLSRCFETIYSGQQDRLPFPTAVDPSSFSGFEDENYLAFLWASLLSGRPIRSIWNGLSLKLAADYQKLLPNSFAPQALNGKDYAQEFLNWSERQDGQWAACVNLMDAHVPYLPTDEHNLWGDDETIDLMRRTDDPVWAYHGNRPWSELNQLMDLYDGCIHQVDSIVGMIVDQLISRGELEETFLVITSDHGEGFGEQSGFRKGRCAGHGPSCGPEEELLHVPLIVKFPGQSSPERVDDIATLTRFPYVVEQVRDNAWTTAVFTQDRPVPAMVAGLNDVAAKRAEKQISELDPFRLDAKVMYVANDHLTKIVSFDGNNTTIDDLDTDSPRRQEGKGGQLLNKTYDAIEMANIKESDDAEISGHVKNRLEDLGYA